jgi:hypothetical protein
LILPPPPPPLALMTDWSNGKGTGSADGWAKHNLMIVINFNDMDHFIHFIHLCSIIKHLFPPFRVGIPLSSPPYMGIFTDADAKVNGGVR